MRPKLGAEKCRKCATWGRAQVSGTLFWEGLGSEGDHCQADPPERDCRPVVGAGTVP